MSGDVGIFMLFYRPQGGSAALYRGDVEGLVAGADDDLEQLIGDRPEADAAAGGDVFLLGPLADVDNLALRRFSVSVDGYVGELRETHFNEVDAAEFIGKALWEAAGSPGLGGWGIARSHWTGLVSEAMGRGLIAPGSAFSSSNEGEKQEHLDSADRAHASDYRAKSLYDSARRAIERILEDEDASGRLGDDEGLLAGAAQLLQGRSDHIVAVWD